MPPSEDQELDVQLEEDRYDRLRLIPWWDQERLRNARVLVVGAGALGNEILKNLALLGVGKIMIADLDRIEDTNLTRAILFRKADTGRAKAEVAAEKVMEINPDVVAQAHVGDINYDLGLGVYRDMDLVFGALDNREARVTINANCWKLGIPWVDGAIEMIQGVARVFVPAENAPCYECTMSELDYKLLSQRRSCALLSRDDVLQGKVPTTPTVASVIGGIQVQEGIKLLHSDRNLPTLAGRGYFFNGLTHDSYLIQYQYRADCPAHEHMFEVSELDGSASTITGKEMLDLVQGDLGPAAIVEFERELCTKLTCGKCHAVREFFCSLGRVKVSDATCPACGELCDPHLSHGLTGAEDYLGKTLSELGIPPYDIVTGRAGLNMKHYLLAADRATALGAVV